MGLSAGINQFAFAGGDPINGSDPGGTDVCDPLSSPGGCAGGDFPPSATYSCYVGGDAGAFSDCLQSVQAFVSAYNSGLIDGGDLTNGFDGSNGTTLASVAQADGLSASSSNGDGLSLGSSSDQNPFLWSGAVLDSPKFQGCPDNVTYSFTSQIQSGPSVSSITVTLTVPPFVVTSPLGRLVINNGVYSGTATLRTFGRQKFGIIGDIDCATGTGGFSGLVRYPGIP
jgi:hypothetical protein